MGDGGSIFPIAAIESDVHVRDVLETCLVSPLVELLSSGNLTAVICLDGDSCRGDMLLGGRGHLGPMKLMDEVLLNVCIRASVHQPIHVPQTSS